LIHRFRDRIVDTIVQGAVKGSIRELNQLRQNLSVPAVEKYEDIFTRPDLLLYRTSEPFDYPREKWPDNILPIGPGLWAPPAKKPDWLESLPSPKILVSISTEMQDDAAIIETALQALSDTEGSIIVTTGALNPDRFEAPHQNVHITDFLPHSEVIPDMDLVVTHGGMGTTQRALAAGVPVCVVPWGRDQSETARRVELSGSGTMLPKNKLNENRLKKAIHEAMNCTQGANTIAEAFKATGGAKTAVDAILEMKPKPVLV
jgi:MGT family glycosyltransferase